MTLCATPACACAFQSQSLTITQAGNVVTLEMAGDSEITQLRDDLDALQAAYDIYVAANDAAVAGLDADVAALVAAFPTTTTTWASPINAGITVGAGGAVSAVYAQLGPLVFARFKFTFGAGSAITGDVSLVLPVAASSSWLVNGSGTFFDTSASGVSNITFAQTATTTILVRATNAAGTYDNNAVISSTIPFTWATGDIMSVTLFYQVA